MIHQASKQAKASSHQTAQKNLRDEKKTGSHWGDTPGAIAALQRGDSSAKCRHAPGWRQPPLQAPHLLGQTWRQRLWELTVKQPRARRWPSAGLGARGLHRGPALGPAHGSSATWLWAPGPGRRDALHAGLGTQRHRAAASMRVCGREAASAPRAVPAAHEHRPPPARTVLCFIASICLPWQCVCFKAERRDSHCYREENRT